MTWKNCCWKQSGLLIKSSHAVSLRADYRNVDRFSSESDVGEKAKIVVDKLREVNDE
jgi:hypothetical protein